MPNLGDMIGSFLTVKVERYRVDSGPAISLIDRPVCGPRNAGDLDGPECMSNRGRGAGWTGLLSPVCAPS